MYKFFIILIIFSNIYFFYSNDLPFKRGVNFTYWLEFFDKNTVMLNYYTKEDFENVKKLGCDVVRLPINFNKFLDKNMKIEKILLEILDRAINYCEELEIYLIIDNHSFDPFKKTEINEEKKLIAIWKQIANRYKNRSNFILYEILNEPHGISNETWGKIQKKVVNEIRKIDKNKYIVVTPSEWGNFYLIDSLPDYGENIIHTFHFYEPMLFTHQKANWTTPSMEYIEGINFPCSLDDEKKLQNIFEKYKNIYENSWIENLIKNYGKFGTFQHIDNLFEDIKKLKNKGYKLYCGEFGVYNAEAPEKSRKIWYEYVRKKLETLNISWTIWDYQGGFGIFKKGSRSFFPEDLDIELLNSLGLNTFINNLEKRIIKFPENIYSDGFDNFFIVNVFKDNGLVDFYNKDSIEGEYSIKIFNLTQYDRIVLEFRKKVDLTNILNKNLTFYVKTNSLDNNFDINFIDSVENDNDKPWRIGFTVKLKNYIKKVNQWKKITIPISQFSNKGTYYKNQWYTPEGEGDWKNIEKLEFVIEEKNMNGKILFIDGIKITE